jgi:hypothetical protein
VLDIGCSNFEILKLRLEAPLQLDHYSFLVAVVDFGAFGTVTPYLLGKHILFDSPEAKPVEETGTGRQRKNMDVSLAGNLFFQEIDHF